MPTPLKFKCGRCRLVFDAEGRREEWADPVFGPSSSYKAACPSCGAEVREYRPKLRRGEDSESGLESAGEEGSDGGACGMGEGACGGGSCGQDFGGLGG